MDKSRSSGKDIEALSTRHFISIITTLEKEYTVNRQKAKFQRSWIYDDITYEAVELDNNDTDT